MAAGGNRASENRSAYDPATDTVKFSMSGPNPSGNPSTINTPQQVKIATTGVAVQVPAGNYVNGVVLKARSSNAATVLVGRSAVTVAVDGTGNGYPLAAGEAISYGLAQSSDLWINGTAGDIVYVTGN